MRTRTAVAGLAVAAAALSLGFGLWALRRDPRPDLILIVWDTCRADRWSCYGYGRPTTPNLDAFAKGAARFERCYATSPWTAPSHASIFTGLLSVRHGLDERLGARVRSAVPLLAETLRREGYETVGFTANAYISKITGLSRGFDFLDPIHEREGATKTADGGAVLAGVEAWLEAREKPGEGRKPLFLFVNLMDTHLPYRPPAEVLAAVRDPAVSDAAVEAAGRFGGREALTHAMGVRRIGASTLAGLRTRYDGAVRHVDAVTGALFDRLREAGILEGAVVVVTSDHGEHLGEKGRLDHRMSVHDVLLHVPLVLRWPGRFDDGRVVSTQVSLADLHPTLLEAAGVPVPEGTALDAESLTAASGPGRPLFVFHDKASDFILQMKETLPADVDERSFDPMRVSRKGVQRVSPDGRHLKYVRFTLFNEDGSPRESGARLHDLAEGPVEEADLLPADPEAGAAFDALIEAAEKGPTVLR